MKITPEKSSVSIVLVGSMNSLIFRPGWFAKNGLISETEAEAAEIEVIHKELTLFKLDWCSIRVEPTRFVIDSEDAPFIRISDLAVRTFKEFLVHTPVTMLGINRVVSFDAGSDEARDKIGNVLAPKQPWGDWAADLEKGNGPARGGMRSLTMQQTVVDDGREEGWTRAKIEPSMHSAFGIYMEVNDHFQLKELDSVSGAEPVVTMLEGGFEESIRRSEWIIQQIMDLI